MVVVTVYLVVAMNMKITISSLSLKSMVHSNKAT